MTDQTERELGQALRTQAQAVRRAPFTMQEVRGASARIKRRRIAAAGAATAVAVGLVVPALLLGGDREAGVDPSSPPSAEETSVGPSTLPGVSGPGVHVELADAPGDTFANAEDQGIDLNMLLVHTQDIQAVVDAMSTAGADAITINRQRITPETVIECVGNTVVLDGVPYPQPFVIEAVGDPDTLVRAINRSDYLAAYRAQASNPLVGVRWALEVETRVEAPAYRPAGPR
jgi:Bacterial protein of unknown function (DUF881)